MDRIAQIERITSETRIVAEMNLDGSGTSEISTGIPFFDHMLDLFTSHGFIDLVLTAKGDLEVDSHHTVEDIGIVLGKLFNDALKDRKGIKRYGTAVTPMDETLTEVSVDLSKRPFFVYNLPFETGFCGGFDTRDVKEFFRAFSVAGGLNLHINVRYGENEHHIIESVFKAFGRALDQATSFDERIVGCHSTKGVL